MTEMYIYKVNNWLLHGHSVNSLVLLENATTEPGAVRWATGDPQTLAC